MPNEENQKGRLAIYTHSQITDNLQTAIKFYPNLNHGDFRQDDMIEVGLKTKLFDNLELKGKFNSDGISSFSTMYKFKNFFGFGFTASYDHKKIPG